MPENRRLAALIQLGILDTPPEKRFDRLTRIVQRFYNVPTVLFSIVDEERQWFKSKQGLETKETPRSIAFCDYAIQQDSVFVVEDAREDSRFRDNPLVTGKPHIRFYAGMPVREPSGFKIGSLCLIDTAPRQIPEHEFDILRSVAHLIEDEITRTYSRQHSQEFVPASQLSQCIHRAQNIFLSSSDENAAFGLMLNDILTLTYSHFGFIGEFLHRDNGDSYLKIGAITNITWNPEIDVLYQQVQQGTMIIEDPDSLIGASLKSTKTIIVNDYPSESRKSGLPAGHPLISSYCGVPIFSGDKLIGLVGLANRQAGYSEKLTNELEPLLQTVGQLIERKRLYDEKLEHTQDLERAANYDTLTGLPNRRLLTELFQTEINEADKRHGSLSVCFIDLDGFKDINDDHGHAIGDAILKTVASRLTKTLRGHDIIARLGGDEFVAILRDVENDGVYERILQAIRKPIHLGQRILQVSGSMGVTLYPEDNTDTDLLLRHADQSMYAAKKSGKNQLKKFDVETNFSRNERVKTLKQLPDALRLKQFELYLQPKIDLRLKRVEGFEALLRWNHPEEGLIGPMRFLPHLEYTEYAVAVGKFVVQDAVQKLTAWRNEGLSYSLSINLSPSHFVSSHFVDDLNTALVNCDKAMRNRLIIELLETTAFDDTNQALMLLRACRRLGVQISLDDFGTGYASLNYFRRLPADEVKIDRSFVSDMIDDIDNDSIVGAIIGLSKSFRRRVVAEGIEDQKTQDRLIEMGCHLGQGFFYTKPLPAAQALSWAKQYDQLQETSLV